MGLMDVIDGLARLVRGNIYVFAGHNLKNAHWF